MTQTNHWPILRVTNWRRYQHYQDRNPPWVKLHRSTLWSEDWVLADDSTRVLMMVTLLLASEGEDGTFIANPQYVKRLAYLSVEPNWAPLITSRFLTIVADPAGVYDSLADASTAQADASTMQACARPEERREEERRGEEIHARAPGRSRASKSRPKVRGEATKKALEVGFGEFWDPFPRKVAKVEAATVWLQMVEEDRAAAIAAVPDHVGMWKREGRTVDKIPHPSTWLRQRRWEDVIASRYGGYDRDSKQTGLDF